MSTRGLAESVEGLNSALAQSPGKLYDCKVLQEKWCTGLKGLMASQSSLLYSLAWTVANVGGPNSSWRLCVFDWCACVLQTRCTPEELQLSFYCFRYSPESARCKYNLDQHWQLWRAYLSMRREFARAVYPPPVTAAWCPSVKIITG